MVGGLRNGLGQTADLPRIHRDGTIRCPRYCERNVQAWAFSPGDDLIQVAAREADRLCKRLLRYALVGQICSKLFHDRTFAQSEPVVNIKSSLRAIFVCRASRAMFAG